MFLRCAVLVAMAAQAAVAVPVSWDHSSTECATSCPQGSKFGWEPSKQYEYTYTGDMKTLLQGASEEHSSLHIKADVTIEVLTRCELLLKLSNVDLLDSDPRDYDNRSPVPMSGHFKSSLQANTLRFGFKDGLVDALCPQEGEEIWVLNIKRGIISQLQNNMVELSRTTSLTETDISGECPVLYKPLGSGKILKSKDILGCVGGHSYDTIFQSVPYGSSSRIQSLPLLKSSHECEQTWNGDNVISQVTCLESHMFRPFSREDSGAVTIISTSLRLESVSDGRSRQDPIRQRESLVFDDTPQAMEMEVQAREANEAMRTLCDSMTDDVRPEVPGLFGKLVRIMKKLDSDNLMNLYTQSKRGICTRARKYFVDAIPMLQTAGSVALIRDLVVSGNELSEIEADIWETSIAMITRPSLQMLQEAKPMVTLTGHAARKGNLAVSALVNNYCHHHSDCDSQPIIAEIMSVFEQNLNYNCRGDHDNVLMALKAIGNAGHTGNVDAILDRCMNNAELPMEIRVAAITAHRRLPCDADRTDLKNIYTDEAQDSELRINAYLQLIKCATPDLIAQIAYQLGHEDINQVGSFVWTHLTNLMETSEPLKQDIGKIVEDADLNRAFDLDARKFSRNIELSAYSHLLNTGAAVESNLIWSEKSFIPRTASLNVTFDVFGRAMNLIEVDGRVEGFDTVLEDIFGPKREMNEVMHGRNKRDAIDAFDDGFNIRSDEGPQISYSIKVFGNEIRYDDFHNLNLEALKGNMNYLDWLIALAQNHQYEFNQNLMIVDTTMTVPTATGMPLKLDCEGSSTVNVKVNGKLDIRRMFTWPSNIDIDGSIVPSGAMEFISTMGIDGHCAKTGLQLVENMHSSTILQGKLQLQDGSIFSFDVDMPNDKVEVFSAESKFLITHREEKREQAMLTDNVYTFNECMDLYRPLGIELCGEASIPLSKSDTAPVVPFTGPVKLSMVINKKDSHTGYNLQAKFVQEKTRSHITSDLIMFSMNAPGGGIEREIMTSLSVDRVGKSITYILKSPWKTIDFNANFVNDADMKSFSINTKIGSNKEYSLEALLPIAPQKNGVEYTPSITLAVHGLPTKKITGRLFYNPGRKVEYELRARNIFKDNAKLHGEIVIQSRSRKKSLVHTSEIESSFFNCKLDTSFEYTQGKSMSNRINLDYSLADGKKENILISNKLKDESTGTLTQYDLDSHWTNTINPAYNGDLDLDYTYGRNNLIINLDTGFDQSSRVKVTQSGNFDFEGDTKKVDGLFKLELPGGKEYEVTIKHSNNENMIGSMASFKYGPDQQVIFDGTLERQSTTPFKASADITFSFPGREFKLKDSLEQTDSYNYHHNVEMSWAPGKQIVMDTTVQMRPRMELTTDLTIPSLEPIKVYTHFNPMLRDLQAKAQFNYGASEYGVDGNWNHGGNFNAFQSRGNFEMVYPARRIKSSLELSRRDALITGKTVTQWDVDNDEAKQLSVEVRTTLTSENPSFYMKADYHPNQFFEVSANHRYETTNWMRTSNDYEANLSFKSSYDGFEDLTFAMNYDHSPNQVEAHAEMGAGRQKIISDLNMRKNEDYTDTGMTLSVKTPFNSYRNMELSANYVLQGRNVDSGIKVVWDDKEISLTGTGQFNIRRHSIDSTITLTTPFTEPIVLRATHSDNGQVFTTNIGLNWKGNQNMNYEQTLTYEALAKLGADIKFTSPFTGLEEITLNSNTEVSGATYTTNHELKWAPEKLITLTASLTPQLGWEGSIRLTTPWSTFDRLVMTTHNRNNNGVWESHADIEYTGIEKVELDTRVGIDSVKKIGFTFKCPPGNADTTYFDAEFNGGLRQFDTSIVLGNDRYLGDSISLKAELDSRDMRNTIASINYKSPVGLEFFTITFANKKQGRTYTTDASLEFPEYKGVLKNVVTITNIINFNAHTELEYKPGAIIDMAVSIESNPKYEGRFSLSSPFHHPISVTVDHTGQPEHFTSNFNLNYGVSQSVTSRLHFEHEGTNKIELDFNLQTPWTYFEDVSFEVEHEASGTGVESKAEFSWSPSDKMTAEFELELSRGTYKSELRITTPFSRGSRIVASIEQTGVLTDFTNKMSFEFDSYKYTIDSAFKVEGSDVTINTEISTPIPRYELITAKIDHSGPPSDFTTSGEFVMAGKTRTFEITTKIEPKIEIRFELDGISLELGRLGTLNNVKGGFNHESKNWRNFNADGFLEFDGQRYSSNMDFKWYGKTFRLNTAAENPNNDYGVNIKHKGGLKNFENSFVIDIGKQEIKAESNFKLEDGKTEGKIEVTTPFRGYRKAAIEVNHEGSLSDFTTTLKVDTPATALPTITFKLTYAGNPKDFSAVLGAEFNDKKAETTVKFNMANLRDIEGSIVTTTPYEGYERFAAEFEYESSGGRKGMSFSVDTPFENFQKTSGEASISGKLKNGLTATLNLDTSVPNFKTWLVEAKYLPQNREISAKVVTSIPGYESFSASASSSGALENLKAGILVETSVENFNKFSTDFSLEISDSGFSTELKAETPFQNWRTMSTGVSGSLQSGRFNTRASLETSYPGYESWSVDISNNVENGDAFSSTTKVDIVSPIQNYNSFSTQLQLEYEGSTFKIGLTGTSSMPGYEKFVFSLANSSERGGYKTEGIIETSIKGWEKFGVTLTHTPTSQTAFRTTLTVDTPFRKYGHFELSLDHEGLAEGFASTVTVNTPFRKAREISVTVNHQGVLKDFTTGVTLAYAPDKQIDTEVKFKTDGRLYEAGLKINTPFSLLRNIDMIATHDRSGSGNLDITHNNNKFLDLDYVYTKKTPFTLRITTNNPRPYEIKINYDQTGKSCTGDITLNFEGQQFRLESEVENSVEEYKRETSFSIAVSLPNNKYRKFSMENTANPNRVTQDIAIQWARNEDSKATMEMEYSNSKQRGQKIGNGHMNIASPWHNSQSTINHVVTSNRKYETDIVVQSSRRIVFKNVLDINTPSYSNKFTMQHPDLSQDMEVGVEATVSLDIIEGSITAKLEDESIDMYGKLSNQENRPVVACRLAHPTTNLDMDFHSELYNDEENVGTNSHFKWKTLRDRQIKVYKMVAEINKIRKELKAELSCPGRSMTMTGQKSVSDVSRGIFKWNIAGNSDLGSIQAEFEASKPDRSITGFIQLGQDKIGYNYKIENAHDRKFESYHETDGRRVQDILLSLAIARDRTFTHRTYFRPNMIQDLKNYVTQMNVETNGNCFTDVVDLVSSDLNGKTNEFMITSMARLKASGNVLAGEQLALIQSTYQSLYDTNAYNVRTISNSVNKWFDWSEGKMNRMIARGTDKVKLLQRKFAAKLEFWTDKLNRIANNWAAKADAFMDEYGPMIQDINELIDAVTVKVKKAHSYIKNHPIVKKFRQGIKTMKSIDLIEPIETLYAKMATCFEQFKQSNSQYFDILGDLWGNVEKKTEVRQVNKYVMAFRDWAKQLCEHYDLKKKAKKLNKELRDVSLDAVQDQIWQEVQDRFKPNRNRVKNWDPKNGNYEVEFYIPEDPFKDMHLAKLYLKENLYKIMDWVKETWPEEGIDYYALFYTYKPPSHISEWLPPFSGHASISGHQHYMTFDKKFYEFSGECSYMLARDFINGLFSVVVNYDRSNDQVTKTITVNDGDKSIEINNGKVLVDGNAVEMPLMLENTMILRMGSEIRIDNKNGATVICALHYDHCTLNVTGWYYGKTGGLWGTYDNEPATDFTTSTNERTNDVEEFTNSWVMGQSCTGRNLARKVALADSRRYKICAGHFIDAESAFRSCYSQVDNSPFMQMCINDMGSVDNEPDMETDVCKSAALYVSECKRHGVPLRIPRVCVKCVDPKGEEFPEGSSIELEGDDVPMSADVLFVVQHTGCNREVISQIVDNKVVENLDAALKSEGMKHNRFGMIGYGGEGMMSVPHSHTIGGELMGNARGLTLIMAEMDHMSGEHLGDGLHALREASKYPFRTGVSKTVILLPCDACSEGKVKYHEIQQLLSDRDINLHVLLDHEFTLKGGLAKGPKTSSLFGVDSDGLFTRKHLKGVLTSDKELYNQVRLPKDICGALAVESGGTSFSVHYLLDSRREVQKKFTEVMVRVHADIAQPTECQRCECVPGEDGVGVSVCENCNKRSLFSGFYPEFFGMNSDNLDLPEPSVDQHFEERMNRDNRGPPSRRPNRNRPPKN